ncbi:MAG: NAD-dependent epimerase/dehydratase family protein [Saprospiraceae bacterium]
MIPALIRKCVEARESGATHIDAWGTGSASREFLHVDDAAEGVFVYADFRQKIDLLAGHSHHAPGTKQKLRISHVAQL